MTVINFELKMLKHLQNLGVMKIYKGFLTVVKMLNLLSRQKLKYFNRKQKKIGCQRGTKRKKKHFTKHP